MSQNVLVEYYRRLLNKDTDIQPIISALWKIKAISAPKRFIYASKYFTLSVGKVLNKLAYL